MSNEYVLVHCHCESKPNMVLVLKKSKPKWQNGLLNLPGGQIEAGETSIQAAVRELKEETGYVSTSPIEHLGCIYDGDAIIHCCRATVKSTVINEDGIDEQPFWQSQEELFTSPILIPNLRVIIPLLSMGVQDWVIKDNHKSEKSSSHEITVRLRTYSELTPVGAI